MASRRSRPDFRRGRQVIREAGHAAARSWLHFWARLCHSDRAFPSTGAPEIGHALSPMRPRSVKPSASATSASASSVRISFPSSTLRPRNRATNGVAGLSNTVRGGPCVSIRPRLISVCRAVYFEELASVALTESMLGHNQRHIPPGTHKLQPFFRMTVVSASLSRLRSATAARAVWTRV